jgi:hypothetical protein
MNPIRDSAQEANKSLAYRQFTIKEDKGKVVMFLDDKYYQDDCKDKLNSLKSDINKYNEAKKTYKPNIETIKKEEI